MLECRRPRRTSLSTTSDGVGPKLETDLLLPTPFGDILGDLGLTSIDGLLCTEFRKEPSGVCIIDDFFCFDDGEAFLNLEFTEGGFRVPGLVSFVTSGGNGCREALADENRLVHVTGTLKFGVDGEASRLARDGSSNVD